MFVSFPQSPLAVLRLQILLLGADIVYGIISLIDSEKGERKEHACAKACLQHLGTPRKMQA
jgi:hypothetical protein